jgi:hypothetical protein
MTPWTAMVEACLDSLNKQADRDEHMAKCEHCQQVRSGHRLPKPVRS